MSNLEFAREVARKMELNATWETIPSLGDGATSTFDEAEDVLAYGKGKRMDAHHHRDR